ncbi:MAG: serine/threonine-protein kinase [Polyangiaceae bacterium]
MDDSSARRVTWRASLSPVTRARFLSEVRAFSRCDHPGVVRVREAGESSGKPYFVTAPIEGAPLSERTFASAEERVKIVAAYFLEAARAVEALHASGVLHRDLRPERLIVTPSKRLVVMEPDFTALLDADTAAAEEVESRIAALRLAPPERVERHLLDLDARADIYSLGAAFYEILTGRPFLSPSNEDELTEQVRFRTPPPAHALNPKVPRELSAILAMATQKDRAHRYPDAAALIRDLTAFQEGRPVEAHAPPLFSRLEAWGRRHRTLALSAGVLLATGVLSVALLWFLRRGAHVCAEGDAIDCARQCDRGSGDSCAILGGMAERGAGAEKDPARALALFERACDADSSAGCEALGRLLGAADRTADDQGRARDAHQRTCDLGRARGCDALGTMFVEGRGGAADPAAAAALFDRACRSEVPEACGHLGALAEQGRGVPEDASRARSLYMRACSEGAPSFCAVTAEALTEGRGGQKDQIQAARLFERACSAGVLRGCAGLGRALIRGAGVPRDIPQGESLLRRACEGGLPAACDPITP